MHKKITFPVAGVFFLLCAAAHAQPKKDYYTKSTITPPVIDGALTDKVWNTVKWGGDFVRYKPTRGNKPSSGTRFKILYDSAYLYIAIRCFDRPDSIAKVPTPRDGFGGDWVDIELNCSSDTVNAHALTVTASGVRGDEYMSKGGAYYDAAWNPEWEAKSHIDKQGWTAEMKIPLNQLKYDGTPPKTWGLQFTRWKTKGSEQSSWQLMPTKSTNRISNFGTLYGIEHIQLASSPPKQPYNPKRLYEPAELRQDFAVLRKVLEGIYPSLYRFYSKPTIDSAMLNIYESINGPMTELEYYKLITPLFDIIGDGHIKSFLSNDFGEFSAAGIKKLPVQLMIIDGQAYVLENYSLDSTLIPGTRILSINGRPFHDILTELMKYVTSDGYNLTRKYYSIGQQFGYYYSLLDAGSDRTALEIILPGKMEIKTVQLERLPDREIEQNKSVRYPSQEKNFELLWPDSNTALLKIKTFMDDWAFRQFADTAFAIIWQRNIPNVIIDLRNNGGGNDYNGAYLFSYLTDKPFAYYRRFETAVSIAPSAVDSICCISREDLAYLDEISAPDNTGVKVIRDFKASRKQDPSELHQPAVNNFKGNLYVLINGGSFSCSSEFCSVADFHHRAIFIGEETGGGYYGNTGNMFREIVLPNTGLRFNIAFIKYLSAVEGSDAEVGRGIMPDYEIKPNALDIKNGVDRELNFAMEIIQHKK